MFYSRPATADFIQPETVTMRLRYKKRTYEKRITRVFLPWANYVNGDPEKLGEIFIMLVRDELVDGCFVFHELEQVRVQVYYDNGKSLVAETGILGTESEGNDVRAYMCNSIVNDDLLKAQIERIKLKEKEGCSGSESSESGAEAANMLSEFKLLNFFSN